MPKISFCDDLDAPLLGVIMNHEWWDKNQSEAMEWFRQNNTVFSNLLVLFPDNETKFAFMLRWWHND